MDIEALLKQKVLAILQNFNNLNYRDPLVRLGITASVTVEMSDIQDTYPEFDGDCEIEFDPEPVLVVGWWINGIATSGVIITKFRFNPIRLDSDDTDLIAAYDRAMKVL